MTSTQVAKANCKFSGFMSGENVKRQINEIIAGKKGESFITSIVASVSNNPALADCENGTILSAGLQGAALDLSPSPSLGHFYMVPYDDRKNGRKVAQFQIGYKGYVQLAIRSGQYRRINVIALKEGELINYNRLTEEIFTKLIDDDEVRDKMQTTGYYAMFELSNGFIKSMYWSFAKMQNHAMKYSKGYAAQKGYTFWEKDFDGMAFKTMLRQLLSKWGVMSIEMQRAFEADMSTIDAECGVDYIDNQQNETAPKEKEALPAVTEDQFNVEMKSWVATVECGAMTASDILAAARCRYTLTEQQVANIESLC